MKNKYLNIINIIYNLLASQIATFKSPIARLIGEAILFQSPGLETAGHTCRFLADGLTTLRQSLCRINQCRNGDRDSRFNPIIQILQ
jgi:hypothetical protein